MYAKCFCTIWSTESLHWTYVDAFPLFPASLFLITSCSVVFLTDYDYVIASFICRYQDIFVVEFLEGCPTSSVFQNLSFSCFMSPRLKTSDIVFNKEFYRACPLIECARVYSLSRSPRISIIVYSLHAQFQTQILVDIISFSKIRAFFNEVSKFPIGYDAEVASDHMA